MIYFGREYCTAKNHEVSELYSYALSSIYPALTASFSLRPQNAGCPICSWVNTKAGKPPASLSLAHFEPKRVTKGIVYYQERLRELEANPEISIHSPFKKAQIPVTVAVAEANNCDEDDNAVGAALTADLAAEDTAADAESAGNGSTFSNSVSTKSKRKPTIKLERKTRNSSNIRSEDTEAAPAEKKRKRYKDV